MLRARVISFDDERFIVKLDRGRHANVPVPKNLSDEGKLRCRCKS
jgi:hypothetical protein